MAKKQLTPVPDDARYEHRVWGKRRSARKLLAELADEVEGALRDALDSEAELPKLTKAVRRAAAGAPRQLR